MRQRARGDAEPLVGAPLRLAELVSDHQSVDLRHLVRDGDLDRVGSIPLIGWNAASRGVWLCNQAEILEFGEDAAHRCWRDAEAVGGGDGAEPTGSAVRICSSTRRGG